MKCKPRSSPVERLLFAHPRPRNRKAKSACAFAAAAALAFMFCSFSSLSQAQTYTEKTIYNFTGGANGVEPVFSGVVRDSAGNFYGTTYAGGAHNRGTVWKIDQKGEQTVLHSFSGPEGSTPYAGLVLSPAGVLYGTTHEGGTVNATWCTNGCGVVFLVNLDGNERTLYRFTGGNDGGSPVGGVIRDSAGNLYGTTEVGGASNYGTVFKVDAAGAETVLHSFAGWPDDGQAPQANLIQDSAGNFYGTTSNGGTAGFGTVFEVEASGLESVLYSFKGETDGSDPMASLLRDAQGNLYGTTFFGGLGRIGTVFKLDASGNETILHSFNGNDGAYPEGPLVRDAQDNLYGTALQGGPAANDGGTIFKITAQGEFSVLWDFAGDPNGENPAGPLIMDSAGNLYGTTAMGGPTADGSVFKLTP
jgi:uncharacterized repeat protein (TIGR03803 family)